MRRLPGASAVPEATVVPNRYVKERARRSPSLHALSDAAERLFWRLKLAADDFGRFSADPRVLVAECFPLRVGERGILSRCMQMYAELGAGEDPICLTYRVGDRLYGIFRKWDETPRAKASKFPAPPPDPWGCAQVLARGEHVQADAEHVPASAYIRMHVRADAPVTGIRLPIPVSESEGGVGGPEAVGPAGTAPDTPAPRALGSGDANGGGTGTARRLPDEAALTDADEAYAKAKGFDETGIDRMFEAFCDYHWAKGDRMRDWSAAWRTWVRRELEGRTRAAARGGRP
jgi:hypothetical protein